ncbi:MAG: nodulation protein NfeD [Candidatus Bathyarchaeia archaeon]
MERLNRHYFLFAFFLLLMIAAVLPLAETQGSSEVLVLDIKGTVTATTADIVEEALVNSPGRYEAVVIALDTPGGSLDATFRVISAIEASETPVIGYVEPRGATAWSAGTYILLGTHIAAMAPHTIIGSGQPVSFSPFGGSQPVNDTKVLNALVAYIEERARMHGRNETAARAFITENLNLNDEEALKSGVIEIVSPSFEDLLQQVDGLTVETAAGPVTLNTQGLPLTEASPNLRHMVMSLISEPMIAYLMFFLGIYALIFGFSSPGHGAEVVGGILILLGLIGLGITGANIGALILISLGVVLLVYELLTPGFGLLGGAGFVMTIIGGLLIFQGPIAIAPEVLQTMFVTFITVPSAVGSFFLFAAYKVMKLRRSKPVLGVMLGQRAEVTEEVTPDKPGFVVYQGELWKARSTTHIPAKTRVTIRGKDGPLLLVEPEQATSRSTD